MMVQSKAISQENRDEERSRGKEGRPAGRRPETVRDGGPFRQHKPEQGKWTRYGTLIGAGAVIAWGAVFVNDRLSAYQDSRAWWALLVAPGIPILFALVLVAVAYWASFVNRKSSDFMIATEGEMKKVNWSSRREVIGSTKVVIVITFLLAAILFLVDLFFQILSRSIGVLKVG